MVSKEKVSKPCPPSLISKFLIFYDCFCRVLWLLEMDILKAEIERKKRLLAEKNVMVSCLFIYLDCSSFQDIFVLQISE